MKEQVEGENKEKGKRKRGRRELCKKKIKEIIINITKNKQK